MLGKCPTTELYSLIAVRFHLQTSVKAHSSNSVSAWTLVVLSNDHSAMYHKQIGSSKSSGVQNTQAESEAFSCIPLNLYFPIPEKLYWSNIVRVVFGRGIITTIYSLYF